MSHIQRIISGLSAIDRALVARGFVDGELLGEIPTSAQIYEQNVRELMELWQTDEGKRVLLADRRACEYFGISSGEAAELLAKLDRGEPCIR